MIPKISTGVDGKALSVFSPLSFNIALTLPHLKPLTKKSPLFRVPVVTIMVATGPLPTSIFDSRTIPVAFDSKQSNEQVLDHDLLKAVCKIADLKVGDKVIVTHGDLMETVGASNTLKALIITKKHLC